MAGNFQTPERYGRVADATDNNWVDRYAPAWTRPYLRLSRADRPIGTWLLLLPCLWGLCLAILSDATFTNYDRWLIVSCAIGAFLMRGAGCTWNDISDRKLDAEVERTMSRPIPSGQVTVRQALAWMIIQIGLSAMILFTYNWGAIVLGIAALIPVAIYPYAKRFTWWPQFFLGIAFNWGALLMWVAHTGTLTIAPVILYISGITWTLFYDTIYAHQDKEDDALIGVKSTARLFHTHTRKWLLGFLIVTVCLIASALIVAVGDQLNVISLLFAIFGIWGFGMHMTWQLRKLNIDDADVCLNLFRSNRDAGLLPLAGFIAAFAAQSMLGAS